ncbi:copper resistance protein NlpE [Dysgonomonas sp. 520]|uniref:copper resistance protein NlpE n=1 Tax=Dysgonomonas sp. 520 TaxID=2302931 RepID=UPI0013D37C3E|nr:copper resistance protein NlpE [Dysgonomonas sp. 520]NDW10602.1 copper resistance protein NlpE [Dysgonomonas sp. 520]
MKKIVFLFATVFLLASCNNGAKQSPTTTTPVDSATTAPDIHNARNSLDYKGTYKGVLPGANSEMEVTIVLTDSTYTKDVIYKDKKAKPFSSKGSYSWDDAGTTITLAGEDKPNQYAVGENKLTQLDVDGKPITGELSEMFILKK